ncbi:MAG: hypothetical protein KF718_10825 [Polyangiaceae bacterium]|nr:hypothetical protein [Polyangiaceae bacterium]
MKSQGISTFTRVAKSSALCAATILVVACSSDSEHRFGNNDAGTDASSGGSSASGGTGGSGGSAGTTGGAGGSSGATGGQALREARVVRGQPASRAALVLAAPREVPALAGWVVQAVRAAPGALPAERAAREAPGALPAERAALGGREAPGALPEERAAPAEAQR